MGVEEEGVGEVNVNFRDLRGSIRQIMTRDQICQVHSLSAIGSLYQYA